MKSKASLRETAEHLRDFKGNVKGDIILGTLSYIHAKKGEEGLNLVKEKIREFEYPSLDEITSLGWYPESLSVMVILSAKEIFEWDDDDIFEMGGSSLKTSFIIKTLIKHFVSLKRAFKEIPKYWDKYFDFGSLKVMEANEKRKIARLAIKGHHFHPDICRYQAGFMTKITQLISGKKNVKVEKLNVLLMVILIMSI